MITQPERNKLRVALCQAWENLENLSKLIEHFKKYGNFYPPLYISLIEIVDKLKIDLTDLRDAFNSSLFPEESSDDHNNN